MAFDADEADETPPFVGAILTNEFVDALPIHRVVGGPDGALLERYVGWDAQADWFAETLEAPSTPRLAAALAAAQVTLVAGQSGEINLAADEWLAAAAARLARGVILTVDYGYQSAELYSPRRREGTFLCYYRHTALDDPYVRIGAQDMTAHVDFGALERAGQRLGLEALGFSTQGIFLGNLGLGDSAGGDAAARPGARRLSRRPHSGADADRPAPDGPLRGAGAGQGVRPEHPVARLRAPPLNVVRHLQLMASCHCPKGQVGRRPKDARANRPVGRGERMRQTLL